MLGPSKKDDFKKLDEIRRQPEVKTDLVGAEIEERKKQGDHRRNLRKGVERKIFVTLWAELFGLFILLMFQGFEHSGFKLNQWVFGIVITGVLGQTFLVLQHVVRNLFPSDATLIEEPEKAT